MICDNRLAWWVAGAVAWVLASCGSGGGGGSRGDAESCALVAGDLVISEWLSDPEDLVDPDTSVTSDAPEWIEIYNATSESQDLSGVTLLVSGSGDAQDYPLRGQSVAASAYFVIGGRNSEGFDYVDLNESFQLNNGGGVIQLNCGETILDVVGYGDRGVLPAPAKGTALAFDGSRAPSALLNDDVANWCAAGDTYDGFNVGSPGVANLACGFVACLDGGVEREVVSPEPGDLVITEVYADAIGADAGKEWIEVYNASVSSLDLNGLRLVNTATNSREAAIGSDNCLVLAAGEYAVIGGSDVPAENGGVSVDVVAPDLLSNNLYNEESTLTVLLGESVIDRAIIPNPLEGQSAYVSELSPDGNDSAASFCFSTASGAFEGLGTPGAANEACNANRDTCLGSAGERDKVIPAVGDLVISEVLADPSGSDSNKEYIEIYAVATVDLNGVVIIADSGSSDRSVTLSAPECLEANAGSYVVVATGDDPLTNGGLSADFVFPQSSSYFFNDPGQTVALELGDGTILDSAVLPDGGPGVAVSTIAEPPTIAGNDTEAGWCLEATAGLFDDTGSPGVAGTCQ